MDLNLNGAVAVVTGAGAGIGLAVTRAFVDEGVSVVAGERHISPALATLVHGGRVRAVEVDLATPEGPAHLIAAAGDRLDLLVNNVGRSAPRPLGLLATTDDEWQASLELNLLASVRACRAAVPVMARGGGGAIVDVLSANAWLPDPGIGDYCAAKAAAWNFTKALSKELAAQNIRVNGVSPGPVSTGRWSDEQLPVVARRMLTGRLTTPEQVAAAVLLLASDAVSGNTTGSVVTVDGGLVPTL